MGVRERRAREAGEMRRIRRVGGMLWVGEKSEGMEGIVEEEERNEEGTVKEDNAVGKEINVEAKRRKIVKGREGICKTGIYLGMLGRCCSEGKGGEGRRTGSGEGKDSEGVENARRIGFKEERCHGERWRLREITMVVDWGKYEWGVRHCGGGN